MNINQFTGLGKLSKHFFPYELLPQTWLVEYPGSLMCSLIPWICIEIIGGITSTNPDLDNYERYDVVAG